MILEVISLPVKLYPHSICPNPEVKNHYHPLSIIRHPSPYMSPRSFSLSLLGFMPRIIPAYILNHISRTALRLKSLSLHTLIIIQLLPGDSCSSLVFSRFSPLSLFLFCVYQQPSLPIPRALPSSFHPIEMSFPLAIYARFLPESGSGVRQYTTTIFGPDS